MGNMQDAVNAERVPRKFAAYSTERNITTTLKGDGGTNG